MTDEKIEFIQNHLPVLESGEHTLAVTLDIPGYRTDTIERRFIVAGERFALKPADVQAVFPPAGSLGDHTKVLPHIILNRSTQPWERKAVPNHAEIPCLALLLFDESENPKPEVIPLGESGFELEPGQDPQNKITVIDVPVDLLKRILPTGDELGYLAHVRSSTASGEFSVIVGNRLPKDDSMSTVHLVSVEGFCRQDDEHKGFIYIKGLYWDDEEQGGIRFNDQGATEIRLASLYSWRFACQDEQQNFKNLLLQLGPGTLRLPEHQNPDVEKYLAMGCGLLPHSLRQGDSTFSWYHGPLIPGENITQDHHTYSRPIHSADELLRFNPRHGLLDISYAAAWQLGRLLALQSKSFSTDLYVWKRTCAQDRRAEQHVTQYLPALPSSSAAMPTTVQTWFTSLERLDGIPFSYLVPDELMLPPKSIRFFFLDWVWLEYLRDGAFSLGRATESDYRLDLDLKNQYLSKPSGTITGFLLRSDVVSGWPGLLVDGYADEGAQKPLGLKRKDQLASDILICLFDGVIRAVDLYLKPESMHFGLDLPSGSYIDLTDTVSIHLEEADSRVIRIENSDPAVTFTSAHFAERLIQAVEKVRFICPAHTSLPIEDKAQA
jgi:hypothetical protein